MIYPISFTSICIAFALAAFFCFIANRKHWLSGWGASAAFCLAAIILLSGNFGYAVPMLIFFVAGSLLGKLPSSAIIADKKAKKPRDAMQVFCNGGVAGACMILFLATGNLKYTTVYFISIAISTTDTFSSELGNYFKGTVYDIATFKKVPKGLSGGVSLQGTLAGLLGAVLIALCYLLLNNADLQTGLCIAAAGFLGMLVDSIGGSLLQAKYLSGNNTISEQKLETAKLVSGVYWMTNDMVNLLSNTVVTFATLAFL